LKKFIRKENKIAMQAHKMKNPTAATTECCKQWVIMHIFRLTKQLSVKFKTKLTARDRVLTIMRILTILHSVRIAATITITTPSSTPQVPYARDLFNQHLLLPAKGALQQHGSSGEGVGKHSGFFTFAAQLFNDDSFTTPFPKDHIPQHLTLKDAHVRALITCRIIKVIYFQKENPKIFSPPQIYASGLFVGLGLMSSSKPEGFVDNFFNFEKLSEMWDEAMKVYRAHEDKYSISGYHGSTPRFVCVCCVICQ
jgi:hypothetical protein